METQNITLSLPKDLLLKVELIAVRRRTSVSGLMTQLLERLVDREDAYALARRRHLAWLDRGADMGACGRASVTRDELHERG